MHYNNNRAGIVQYSMRTQSTLSQVLTLHIFHIRPPARPNSTCPRWPPCLLRYELFAFCHTISIASARSTRCALVKTKNCSLLRHRRFNTGSDFYNHVVHHTGIYSRYEILLAVTRWQHGNLIELSVATLECAPRVTLG